MLVAAAVLEAREKPVHVKLEASWSPGPLTADPDRPLVKDGMLVIRDGRIAAIADGADPETIGRAKRAIDLSGKVATPGFVNVHTHTILTMVRGVAEDMGFAPAYTPGVPHGHEVSPDEAVALARLGALEAMLFGSTLIDDTYVHADLTLPAMAELGLRVYTCGRIHDVDFSRVHAQEWTHRREIGERTLDEALRLFETWHGTENGRLGVQLAAHAPDTCSRALLEDVRRARDASGMRVNTHLAQSKVEVARIKERDGMTPAELLDDVGLLDERLLAAHCIHMSEHDIARAGRAGITVAHIPKGNATCPRPPRKARAPAPPAPRWQRAGARRAGSRTPAQQQLIDLGLGILAQLLMRIGARGLRLVAGPGRQIDHCFLARSSLQELKPSASGSATSAAS